MGIAEISGVSPRWLWEGREIFEGVVVKTGLLLFIPCTILHGKKFTILHGKKFNNKYILLFKKLNCIKLK